VHGSAGLRRSPAVGAVCAAVAAASAAGGLALAANYPLSIPLAIALWCAGAAVAAVRPRAWLFALPALLPVIGLMPWTGWMTVEELDLVVLAAAAGGYASRAVVHFGAGELRVERAGPRPAVPLLLLAFGVSVAVSLLRGVADAGGWQWGWWQGYHEPMNSVRLAKPFFLCLLLWPLWRAAVRAEPERAARRVAQGLAAGLALTGLLVLWERVAYTGLLDFSTDYRVSALFWEMHVGGAALDGFLALTMPFALLALQRARSPQRWALAAAGLLLGAYACLATFSRIVYVAVPLSLALMLGLQVLQRRRAGAAGAAGAGAAPGAALLLVVAYTAGAFWLFDLSGYRGQLAWLGAVAGLLLLAGGWAAAPRRVRLVGLLAALPAGAAAAGIALALDKGAYIAFAAASFGVAVALLLRRESAARTVLGVAAFAAQLVSMVAVGWHVGGALALPVTAAAASALAVGALAAGATPRPAWPPRRRWQAAVLSTMALASLAIGVFAGGTYMGSRLSAAGADAGVRSAHWARSLGLLRGADEWLWGRGLGRYPAALFASGEPQDRTGDARLVDPEGNPRVVLTGRQQEIGWGEVFRLSQRIATPRGPLTVSLKLMADRPVTLEVDVCEKHLLYSGECRDTQLGVAARPGQWQNLELHFEGGLSRGALWAPRLIVFSVGVASKGGRVVVDRIGLVDGWGRELLANGSFSHGLARWFVTSDTDQLPWHMQNLWLHVLFEQGLAGLALFAALSGAAVWRLAAGALRDEPIAPALLAALAGSFGVGLIDSLVDAPRIAFTLYLVLLVALTLPSRPRWAARVVA